MEGRCKHQYVVSFSGGKDSTAMLFMLLERGCRIDRIIYIDTTKEFPQMYDHIEEVQKRIPMKIETYTIPFDYWFCEHVKTKGKAKGCIGYGWPTVRRRWCTELKTRTFSNALKKIPSTVYVGLAVDETSRIQKLDKNKFAPLALWGVTEKDALEYCKRLGFTWGGLYDEGFPSVSCYLCPLQGMKSLELLYKNHKDLWREMVELDRKSEYPFRPDCTLAQLENRFELCYSLPAATL